MCIIQYSRIQQEEEKEEKAKKKKKFRVQIPQILKHHP
jgi:hypothetical protein